MADIAPHHDCPRCPKCRLAVATPVEHSTRMDCAKPADTLWCPACGHFWPGSETENDKAARAYAAWEAMNAN